MTPSAAAPLRIRVIVDKPLGLLDYHVPASLKDDIEVGVPVTVPLGKQKATGYVAELLSPEEAAAPEDFEVKPIEALDHTRPSLPPNLIELILFSADYYATPCGEVLHAALPTAARATTQRFIITPEGLKALETDLSNAQQQLLEYAKQRPKGFTLTGLTRALQWKRASAGSRLRQLRAKHLIELTGAQQATKRKLLSYRRLPTPTESAPRLNPTSQALLHVIPTLEPIPAALLARTHAGIFSRSRLKTLERHGFIERIETSQSSNPYDIVVEPDVAPAPTDEQAEVIGVLREACSANTFKCFLLQGVTGSGKTEVYLQTIERCLAMQRTALVLVPEIALTPQLGGRFRARFGERVATFHSGLTPDERRHEWERVRSGEAPIGLGARSALFLPLKNIGIIIVDEEHETSFKQEESPRYNARDLAVLRSRSEGAVCILGSATPSLETRANADNGRYHHLRLNQRVFNRPLPPVEVIPLSTAERVGDGIFTQPLLQALQACLDAGDQAILFLNRRGFAPYVFCKDCGTPFRCPDCDVSLTLHRRRNCLMCHYCGFEQAAPTTCPECESDEVGAHGIGTERVEAELKELLGDVPTIRLDRDTVRRRVDLETKLNDFKAGKAQVLIGTQMVAKGHDFPGVTLVGVITADTSLNFPDFRAGERTFQLLTQVAGRAGRGDKPGRVIVQAFETEHYAVNCATTHNYDDFVIKEMEARHELRYPPYSHLAILRFESEEETLANQEADKATERLRTRTEELGHGVSVLGPAPAPLARLKGIYRVQVLLKSSSRRQLREVLSAAGGKRKSGIRQILDVDPVSML